MSKPKTYDLTGLAAFLTELGNSDMMMDESRQGAQGILDRAKARALSLGLNSYAESLHLQELEREGRRVMGVVSEDPKGMIYEAKWGILARATKGR